MATVMAGVDQRTQLAGSNRMELLLFRLAGPQRYGINVFKVQEVVQCPPLTHIPNSHHVVRGVANMRGRTISMIDLGMAIGHAPLEDPENSFVIVTEYNRSVQGFLVNAVERIINLNWQEIVPPPKGAGKNNFLTAVTRVDDELVEIIDVEKVLVEVVGEKFSNVEELMDEDSAENMRNKQILVVDDSTVARNQIQRTLERMGVTTILAKDGKEALKLLTGMVQDGENITDKIAMIISDIEMPNMDGYTFTSKVKGDPRLKDLYVLLHTSMSGGFNKVLIDKVGADAFVPKFEPDELAFAVMEKINAKATADL
jgi:two-component system chemotaxis response regulator CheV